PAYQPAGPATQSERPRAKRSLLPWFLMATAVLLLAGGVGLWLLLRPSTPISARLQATEDGKEQLELSCLACPDGSQIRLKSQAGPAASFTGGRASLSLASSLNVGDNQ